LKLISLNIFIIVALLAGCAGNSFVSFYDDDDYDYDDEGYGNGVEKIKPETWLMAHGGARRVERRHWRKNKWPEFGVEGVHVLSENGVAVDWAVLAIKIREKGEEYNNSLSTMVKTVGETFGTEFQVGLRYMFEADDGVWPFVRGWVLWQYGIYDGVEKAMSIAGKADTEGDGDGFGGGAGAGVVFAFGEYRLEFGAGYSWVRTTLDLETTIGSVTIDRRSEKASVGGEPSIWISFGARF